MARGGGIIGAGNLRYMRYYMPQTAAEANWNGGICRDLPPSSIPAGYCYDSIDFNLERPGLAYFRGPLKKYGASFTGGSVSTTPAWLAVPRLNGTTYVLAQYNGRLYQVSTSGGATADRGAMTPLPIDRPVVYTNEPGGDQILVVPAGNGTSAPWKVSISGSPTPSALGGSPPPGRLICVHNNRVVLGNTASYPNRVYFGPFPNTEATWDTTNSFMDTSYPITALASVQGVLLVFSEGFCERLIGDIPPGNVDANMTRQPLGATGCMSPLSIQQWGANILFVNGEGVFVTNGAGFDSLTEKPKGTGISELWRQQQTAVFQSNIVGAVYNQRFYIVSIGNGYQNFICYLPTKAWWKISNFGMSWSDSSKTLSGADEVFHVGPYQGAPDQVVTCSKLFDPLGQGVDEVGLGISMRPSIFTTRMIGDGLGLKAYEHGHLTFTSPSNLNLSYIKGADMEAHGSDGRGFLITQSPFTTSTTAGTLHVQRKRFHLNFDTQAIYMSVGPTTDGITTAPLTETQIVAIECEVRDATYGSISDAVFP